MQEKIEILSEKEIDRAVQLLKMGELVAFPTETVYGLGAPLFLVESIKKIFYAKGRPSDNPLIAHVHCVGDVEKIAMDIPRAFYQLAEVFFPGPLTIVLKASPCVPKEVSAGLPTVAVRCPSHPIAQKLLKMLDMPIVAPSANLSGKPSATSAQHVMEDFQGKIAAVIDGGSSTIGLESTVIDLQDANHPVLLRPGIITKDLIEDVLKQEVALPNQATPATSPGMKYRHYAPRAPLRLFTSHEELQRHITKNSAAKRIILTEERINDVFCEQFPLENSSLYAFLRLSDRMECDELLIFCTETVLKNEALMNRLYKAAQHVEY
ncbi:MAG: L-threonylcarbamoyladenylate synthase [Chlamydiota bacterium]